MLGSGDPALSAEPRPVTLVPSVISAIPARGTVLLQCAVLAALMLAYRVAFSTLHGRDTWLAAFPSYAWQVVFLPGFALLGAFTLLFLWQRMPDLWGRGLVGGGLGCFVVAVGLDFVEGLPREHPLNAQTWLIDRLDLYAVTRRHFGRSAFEVVAHFSKALEETLEALGTTLLWLALLRHLLRRTAAVRVNVAPD